MVGDNATTAAVLDSSAVEGRNIRGVALPASGEVERVELLDDSGLLLGSGAVALSISVVAGGV